MGAFGNCETWITSAIDRAIKIVDHNGLDIKMVFCDHYAIGEFSMVSEKRILTNSDIEIGLKK